MATPPPPLTNDLIGALTDDLVEEFLRRLPPEDPASLVRASLVCKRWCRILNDRGFCRRFCKHHHRMPAMLGFFGRQYANPLLFTPTSSFRPCTAGLSLRLRYVVHACHGRVLLADMGPAVVGRITGDLLEEPSSLGLAVWDPITSDLLELPRLPRRQAAADPYFSWNAVVLCSSIPIPSPSSANNNNCAHLDCHRGPFLVVFVGTSSSAEEVYTYVYSSQAGTWSHTASAPWEADLSTHFYQSGQVAGNTVFFGLLDDISVLEYDLSTQEISSVDLPAQCRSVFSEILLTTTKSGELGVAGVDMYKSWILLWSREAGPDGHFRWTPPSRVIDLSTVPNVNPYLFTVVDILHSLGAIIVRRHDGVLFSVDIESNRMTKLCEDHHRSYYVPYMSLCMPALGAAFTEEGLSAGVSKCKKKKKNQEDEVQFLVEE